MNEKIELEGGCLCRRVRYRVSGEPFDAEFCHCRMCQKVAGAAFANWMDFRAGQVAWTAGAPAEYESSQGVWRGFCARCGSTLSFRDDRYPQYLTLTIASLDDPETVQPTHHIFTESEVSWLSVDDGREKYPRNRNG